MPDSSEISRSNASGDQDISPRVPQKDEYNKNLKAFLSKAREIQTHLLVAQTKYEKTQDSPGTFSNLKEISTPTGEWLTDYWSGNEPGFLEDTYRVTYVPNLPFTIEGINEPIRSVGFTISSLKDDIDGIDNRMFALQISTATNGEELPRISHVYSLSVDVSPESETPRENENVGPGTITLDADKALEIMKQLEALLSEQGNLK